MLTKSQCRAHLHTKAPRKVAGMIADHLVMRAAYPKRARNQRGKVIKKKEKN
jgi:hypothetical protein